MTISSERQIEVATPPIKHQGFTAKFPIFNSQPLDLAAALKPFIIMGTTMFLSLSVNSSGMLRINFTVSIVVTPVAYMSLTTLAKAIFPAKSNVVTTKV